MQSAAGLTEPTAVVGGISREAGGVRPYSLLAKKFGNLKSVIGLSSEGVT